MSKASEIEFKLAIHPADTVAFRRLALLGEMRVEAPKRQRVLNVYFDTPGLALKQHAMALRLRKIGGKWLQTLKTAGTTRGGMHHRGEWEFPLRVPQLDLALFRETPLAELPRSRDLDLVLKPTFTTEFSRTSWLLETGPGQRVEVALDQGVIRCGNREAAICEVEIELLEGNVCTVFDVALALVAKIDMRPEIRSKAERGYRLFRPVALLPTRAIAIELKPKWSLDRAMNVIFGACVDHFSANVEGALSCDDPEYIHQLRVSLRRLRSAMRIFGTAHSESVIADLKWLRDVLGEARDWDVLMTQSLPSLLVGYADRHFARELTLAGTAFQVASRKAARAALTSRRVARMLITIGLWASISGETTTSNTSDTNGTAIAQRQTEKSLSRFAAHEVRRRHRRLMRAKDALAGLTVDARHRIRIDAKRLRYAVEFFSSLLAENRVAPYLAILGEIQSLLGKANDDDVAMCLIQRLKPPRQFTDFAAGWFAARLQTNLAEIDVRMAKLRNARRFWVER